MTWHDINIIGWWINGQRPVEFTLVKFWQISDNFICANVLCNNERISVLRKCHSLIKITVGNKLLFYFILVLENDTKIVFDGSCDFYLFPGQMNLVREDFYQLTWIFWAPRAPCFHPWSHDMIVLMWTMRLMIWLIQALLLFPFPRLTNLLRLRMISQNLTPSEVDM